MSDLNTRRKEILSKLASGQKLIHWGGWSGRIREHASLEADGGINGSDSYTSISMTDYNWLFGNGYIKQIEYIYGGKSILSITEAGKNRLEEM